MLTNILVVLLLSLALLSVIMRKTYAVVPPRELKRQAASGNQLARNLYRAVGYGLSLRVLLWLVLGLSSAGGFVLLTTITSGWVSMLVITLVLWFSFSWLPGTRVSRRSTRLTQLANPAVVWLLHYLDPILGRLARLLTKHYLPGHSGVYELDDMLNLLDLQSQQADSRINPEEISLMRQVLTFGDKKVRDLVRPRKNVKSVALPDTVGPILLDELHASGQTVFPVKKTSRSKEIVASLHLGDLGIHSTGTVADYATQGTNYINEADSLADALHAFYQTKQQLFVVVDNHEEYVGVLTLEDILHTLVGRPPANETLGSHDDPEAVAARHDETEADKSDLAVVE